MPEPSLTHPPRSSLSDRQKTLRLLTREIRARKASAAKVLYEIGSRLNRISDERLYEAGGYTHLSEYLEDAVGISTRSAFRFMRIARHFNARIAARYGSGKLEAALRYMEVTPQKERPGDLLSTTVRLRDDSGQFVRLSLHTATEAQIRSATSLLLEAKRGGLRIPRTLQKKTSALARALPPPPEGMSRSRRVTLNRGRDGRLSATFSAIPLDEIEDFLSSVREHLTG